MMDNRTNIKDGHHQNNAPNPYAKQYLKCYRCLGFGHSANVCPTRRVNLVENIGEDDDKTEEHIFISPDDVLREFEEDTQRTCVVRKLSLSAVKVADTPLRHSLFETKCKIGDQVFDVIVDGGSQSNLISRQLVKQLKLPTRRHPKPYGMGWIRSSGNLKVTEQCDTDFAIGKYCDKGTFDVVDMDVCHLVLGRPWQFDLDACHKGKTNTYEFTRDNVTYVLCPKSTTGVGSALNKSTVSLCIVRPLFAATHFSATHWKSCRKRWATHCPKTDSRTSLFQGRANDAGTIK